MKVNYFRGDSTDLSVKKEALLCCLFGARRVVAVVVGTVIPRSPGIALTQISDNSDRIRPPKIQRHYASTPVSRILVKPDKKVTARSVRLNEGILYIYRCCGILRGFIQGFIHLVLCALFNANARACLMRLVPVALVYRPSSPYVVLLATTSTPSSDSPWSL